MMEKNILSTFSLLYLESRWGDLDGDCM